jgi:hypothetical protein
MLIVLSFPCTTACEVRYRGPTTITKYPALQPVTGLVLLCVQIPTVGKGPPVIIACREKKTRTSSTLASLSQWPVTTPSSNRSYRQSNFMDYTWVIDSPSCVPWPLTHLALQLNVSKIPSDESNTSPCEHHVLRSYMKTVL